MKSTSCTPRKTSDVHVGVGASRSEAGGCPNRGDDEDGDDGDAHNGGIHVPMRWSESCVCVGCSGATSDSALANNSKTWLTNLIIMAT